MTTRITTKSGLNGWQGRLQDEYVHFEEFEVYSGMYGLAAQLGFASAREAWDTNPIVQGSTNPGDYCRVS